MSPILAGFYVPPRSASLSLRHGIKGRALSQESGDQSCSQHTQVLAEQHRTSLQLFTPPFATSLRCCLCRPFSVMKVEAGPGGPARIFQLQESLRIPDWMCELHLEIQIKACKPELSGMNILRTLILYSPLMLQLFLPALCCSDL